LKKDFGFLFLEILGFGKLNFFGFGQLQFIGGREFGVLGNWTWASPGEAGILK
jgi:hypothetical protein